MRNTEINDEIEASIAVKQAILTSDKLIGQIEKLAVDCVRWSGRAPARACAYRTGWASRARKHVCAR